MFSNRFSTSCGVVGVDIGSRTIRMLQLRAGSSGALEVVGAAEVPSRDLTGDQLAQRIKAAFTTGGFAGRRCVVSLPRSDLQVQAVRMPKMSDAELKEAAKWEAVERFGLDPAGAEVDIVRLSAAGGRDGDRNSRDPGGAADPTGAGREEVLIVAAAHAILNARLTPILNAGLRPIAVDTHFGALARLYGRRYRRESDKQFVRAVLEVGSTGSTVIILRGDRIAFCKPIDIGGVNFNQAVAEHLQMDAAEAAELRANRGAAGVADVLNGMVDDGGQSPGGASASHSDASTARAIYEAVRPLMGELAKEVMLCLRYYGVTFRGKPAENIVLTGGECHEPHLAQMIGGACKLSVIEDSTLDALPRQMHAILRRSPGPATSWALAAGLSIREMKESRDHPQHATAVRHQGTGNSGPGTGKTPGAEAPSPHPHATPAKAETSQRKEAA